MRGILVLSVSVAQLETRKFKSDPTLQKAVAAKRMAVARSCSAMSDLCSLDSNIEMCAICLEEYRDSQVSETLVQNSSMNWRDSVVNR